MSVKPSILCVAHARPGRCGKCRHANQGSADFAEGHVFCRWLDTPRRKEHECSMPVELPQKPGGPLQHYFFFEAFSGNNGTFGERADFRVIAEDADYAIREGLQAEQPRIEATEK